MFLYACPQNYKSFTFNLSSSSSSGGNGSCAKSKNAESVSTNTSNDPCIMFSISSSSGPFVVYSSKYRLSADVTEEDGAESVSGEYGAESSEDSDDPFDSSGLVVSVCDSVSAATAIWVEFVPAPSFTSTPSTSSSNNDSKLSFLPDKASDSGSLASVSGFLASVSGFLASVSGFLASVSGFLASVSGFLA